MKRKFSRSLAIVSLQRRFVGGYLSCILSCSRPWGSGNFILFDCPPGPARSSVPLYSVAWLFDW